MSQLQVLDLEGWDLEPQRYPALSSAIRVYPALSQGALNLLHQQIHCISLFAFSESDDDDGKEPETADDGEEAERDADLNNSG